MLADDSGTLRNLLQLYQYDFSEIEPVAIDRDGRFHQLDELECDHGYFITIEGTIAGFALVNHQPSRLDDGENVWWMSEFFVMRRYRRSGVGAHAARHVLHRHPGVWEITETPSNAAAVAFWRNVLAPYGYEEMTFDDPTWGRRSLQRFTIRPTGTTSAVL
jgi:predicted acetyltransferase